MGLIGIDDRTTGVLFIIALLILLVWLGVVLKALASRNQEQQKENYTTGEYCLTPEQIQHNVEVILKKTNRLQSEAGRKI